MICACRRIHKKMEHKWAQGGAERHPMWPAGFPPAPLATSPIHGRGNTLHFNLHREFEVGLINSYRKASIGLNGPPACATKLNSQEFIPNRRQDSIWSVHDKGGAEGTHPLADRLMWGRPAAYLGRTCPTSKDGCMAGVTSSHAVN
jgi:hypothetical protein